MDKIMEVIGDKNLLVPGVLIPDNSRDSISNEIGNEIISNVKKLNRDDDVDLIGHYHLLLVQVGSDTLSDIIQALEVTDISFNASDQYWLRDKIIEAVNTAIKTATDIYLQTGYGYMYKDTNPSPMTELIQETAKQAAINAGKRKLIQLKMVFNYDETKGKLADGTKEKAQTELAKQTNLTKYNLDEQDKIKKIIDDILRGLNRIDDRNIRQQERLNDSYIREEDRKEKEQLSLYNKTTETLCILTGEKNN